MTAKAEFKKWYSACRACVRDNRAAGNHGRFAADHKGLVFRHGYFGLPNGLERRNLNKGGARYANVVWHESFNDIVRPREIFSPKWMRATIAEMRNLRLNPHRA